MIALDGVFVPAATPFDPVTGEVDTVALRANLRAWFSHPIRGVVMGGSTGEAVLLDEDERLTLLEAARDVVPGDRLLVAGTGAESTRATIRRTREAADRGADAVLVQPPAFYRGAMTPERLRVHYLALADASPVPVILYQVPLRFSTLEFETGLIVELANHGNIVGMKDSRGSLELLGDIASAAPRGFQLLVGTGARLFAALEVGAVGGILGVANLVPGESAGIVEAVKAGNPVAAGRLQERVAPLHDGIVGAFGVPGVKRALDMLGMHGGMPRAPLGPAPEKAAVRIRELLEAAGVLARVS
ncbi:MAG: dihydrodipicolinate synthase family protein [Gemmatimonadales bacterium]|nr:MAG: dihydrodipicolinate synthase family protein [Gemmatimonadales bacterium]